MDIKECKLGDRVGLYHPDKKLNGTVKGTVIGGGFTHEGLVYIVELDKADQGYIQRLQEGTVDVYVSAIAVHASGVFGTN